MPRPGHDRAYVDSPALEDDEAFHTTLDITDKSSVNLKKRCCSPNMGRHPRFPKFLRSQKLLLKAMPVIRIFLSYGIHRC